MGADMGVLAGRYWRSAAELRRHLRAGGGTRTRDLPLQKAITGLRRPAPSPPSKAADEGVATGPVKDSESIDNRRPSTRNGRCVQRRERTRMWEWTPDPLAGSASRSRTGFEPEYADNRRPSTRARPRCCILPQRETPLLMLARPDSNRRAPGLGNRCSIRLSYEPLEASAGIEPACRSFAGWYLATRSRDLGAPGPTRTGDLLLRKEPRSPSAPRGLACQVMDSNHRVLRTGFTGRCLQPLGQPGWGGRRVSNPLATRVTVWSLGLFGFVLSAQSGIRTPDPLLVGQPLSR